MSYQNLGNAYRDLRFFMMKDVTENFEGDYNDMYKTLSEFSKPVSRYNPENINNPENDSEDVISNDNNQQDVISSDITY